MVGIHPPTQARGRGARKGAPAKVTMHTGGGALSTAATRRGPSVVYCSAWLGEQRQRSSFATAILDDPPLHHRHHIV